MNYEMMMALRPESLAQIDKMFKFCLEVRIQCECCLLSGHSKLLVITDALLKEVGLSLQGDHVHEVKGVLHIPDLQKESTASY